MCITEPCLCVTRHHKERLDLRKQHFVRGLQSAHWCTQICRQEASGLPCSSGTHVGRKDPVLVQNSVLCRQCASNKSLCSFAFNMSYLEGMLEALWRTDHPSRKRRILAFSYYVWLQPATKNMPCIEKNS